MEKLHEFIGLSPIQVQLIEYAIMSAGQILQSWFRSWNITALTNGNKVQAHISWQLYGYVWLASLTLGLKTLYAGDIIGIIIFFTASAIGLEISIRLKK